MNRFYSLSLILALVLGCGDDDSPSECPVGLVAEGDRCIAFDGGRPDGCLSDELCNGADDDCDGIIDENLSATTFYADSDGDGAGDLAAPCVACDVSVCESAQPEVGAFVDDGDDCDDSCETCFPGAPELCDAIDNDCDALTDESASNTYYTDVDGDGYGVTTETCAACDPSECDALEEGTWVEAPGDCDDTCETCFPGGTEVCDGLDNNCDERTDEDLLTTFFADADGDSHGDRSIPCQACDATECGMGDWSTLDDDCDDTCDTCFPGGTEVCDERDNDCLGGADDGLENTFYQDRDADGYGDSTSIAQFCGTVAPAGWSVRSGDCADHDERANPGNTRYHDSPIAAPLPPGGAYDFNCDGTEEFDFAECGPQVCGATIVDPRSPPCHALGTQGCGNARITWSCSCGIGGCAVQHTGRAQACR